MQSARTPGRRPKKDAKSAPTPTRGPSERLSKPKTSPKLKTSPKTKTKSVDKPKEPDLAPSTPPKPSSLKLSISNGNIPLDNQKSALESLDASTSSDGSTSLDPLEKISEINSDDVDPGVSKIEIPDEIRQEAGQNWRLKEAILNSFHLGKNSIHSHEFARSDSDKKTAEVKAAKEFLECCMNMSKDEIEEIEIKKSKHSKAKNIL